MTYTEYPESHSMAEPQSRLYDSNHKPPFKDALFVGLQHVCTPGLLIKAALGLAPAIASYIIGLALSFR